MDLFKSVAHYLKNTDLYLAVIAFICSGYGMALIYSATLNPVSIKDDGSTKNLYVQGAAILIGFGAFVLMSLIDLEGLRNRWKNFVIVNICLQLLLFTPLGMEVNGQRAWLNLGVTSLQPGELGKLIFIFTMAAHISEVGEYISELRGLAVIALHTLIMMAAVVVSSGDSGMAIQYFMIAVIMLFAAGLSLKWIALGAGVAVASVPVLWNFVLKKYQITRILVLFDPSIDPQAALQTTYGKIAIGSGQLTGQGLTHGTMTQLQNVPENQTDYIFSVAGEELGFLGCMAIIPAAEPAHRAPVLCILSRVHTVLLAARGRRCRHVPVSDVHEHLHECRSAAGHGPDAAVFFIRRHLGAHDVRRARHRRGRAHEGKAELASALSAFTKVKR